MKKYTRELGFDDARRGWWRNGRGARGGVGVRCACARASRAARACDGCGAGGPGELERGIESYKLCGARALWNVD